MKSQISLSDLSFNWKKHTIRVGKYLIPIYIHIKNIYHYKNDDELTVGLTGIEDEFFIEYNKLKLLEKFEKILIHINTEDKLYNNFTKNFLEYHGLNSLYDLFFQLTEYEILSTIKHINDIIPLMIGEYRNRLYEALKLDIDPPSINYKPPYEMPKNIEEYLSYTEFYILCQSIIEFNPTPIFEENKNKAVSEWSLREMELHLSYLTAKNRFEGVQNKWHGKNMQNDKPK